MNQDQSSPVPVAPATPAPDTSADDRRLQHAMALAKNPVAIAHLLQDNEGLRTILGTLLHRANNVLILKVNQRRDYFAKIEKEGLVPNFEVQPFGKKGDLQILARWIRPSPIRPEPRPATMAPYPESTAGHCTDCGADPAHPRSEPLPEGTIPEKAQEAAPEPEAEVPPTEVEGSAIPQMKVDENEL